VLDEDGPDVGFEKVDPFLTLRRLICRSIAERLHDQQQQDAEGISHCRKSRLRKRQTIATRTTFRISAPQLRIVDSNRIATGNVNLCGLARWNLMRM
jgi:hypothetical protein